MLTTKSPRLRFADLSSAIGAGIAGVGLGALAAVVLHGFATWILVLGLVLHVWGMADKHRIEKTGGDVAPWWSTAFYWLCWLAIAGLGIAVVVRTVA